MIQEKPELSPVVRKKLVEIRECWHDLESTTQAKARQLFEANKTDLLVKSYSSLDQRLGQLEGQLAYVDQGQDLTSVNKQLKKLQVSYTSMLVSICLPFIVHMKLRACFLSHAVFLFFSHFI